MNLLKILTGALAAFSWRAEGTHGGDNRAGLSARHNATLRPHDDDVCRAPYTIGDDYERIRPMRRPIPSEALRRHKECLEAKMRNDARDEATRDVAKQR